MQHYTPYIASYSSQKWGECSAVLAFAGRVKCLEALDNRIGRSAINPNWTWNNKGSNEGRWYDLNKKGHPKFFYEESFQTPFTTGQWCDILCALKRPKVIDEPRLQKRFELWQLNRWMTIPRWWGCDKERLRLLDESPSGDSEWTRGLESGVLTISTRCSKTGFATDF